MRALLLQPGSRASAASVPSKSCSALLGRLAVLLALLPAEVRAGTSRTRARTNRSLLRLGVVLDRAISSHCRCDSSERADAPSGARGRRPSACRRRQIEPWPRPSAIRTSPRRPCRSGTADWGEKMGQLGRGVEDGESRGRNASDAAKSRCKRELRSESRQTTAARHGKSLPERSLRALAAKLARSQRVRDGTHAIGPRASRGVDRRAGAAACRSIGDSIAADVQCRTNCVARRRTNEASLGT